MFVDSCLAQAIKDTSSSEDPMDEDNNDSDETNSESSDDEIPIPDSYYTSTQNLNPHVHSLNSNSNDSNEGPVNNTHQRILGLDSNHAQQLLLAPPDNEEDDDCGPVKLGPIMNEVRLVAKKGQSGHSYPSPCELNVPHSADMSISHVAYHTQVED